MRPRLIVLLLMLVAAGCKGTGSDDQAAEIARLAVPSDTGDYVGYQVGGGCSRPHKADAPGPDEGTWGWDYQGWLPRRIMNGWWHGRRDQGGTGAYKTDGPHLYHED